MSATSFVFPLEPSLRSRGRYVDELPDAIARGAILVDIRTQSRRNAEGILLGALAIERNVLEQRLDPTAPCRIGYAIDHTVEWIIVCSQGTISGEAAAALRRVGLHRAGELIGGYRALRASGLLYVAARAAHVRRTALASAQL